MNWKNIRPYITVIIGSALYALSVNLFMVSLNLYSSGLLGISQVIRSIVNLFIQSESQYDWSGIVYFMMNVPLYILAYRNLSHRFFYLSVVSIIVQSVLLVLIPIPPVPFLSDYLTSVVVGGLLGGVGIGLCLQAGGSSGGFDIIAMYFALKNKGSIGQLSLIVNGILYAICTLLFNVETAIYSIIYIGVFTISFERFHTQNIVSHVMIITKNKNVKKEIISQLDRGLTYWCGYGAFTENEQEVLVTVISKYEISELKRIVLELDEHAFIVISEGLHVVGNYQKRLLSE